MGGYERAEDGVYLYRGAGSESCDGYCAVCWVRVSF